MQKRRYKCVFWYYGGKSSIAHKYPKPKHDIIIEPFAGGAGYSLLYNNHSITLVDKDPMVCAMWKSLINGVAKKQLKHIPDNMNAGDNIRNLIPQFVDQGLYEIVRNNCFSSGTFTYRHRVSPFGAMRYNTIKPKILYYSDLVRHWRVFNASYEDIENIEATWFVDPPYNNNAGLDYRFNKIDYSALAGWCLSRKGYVIVCEQYGASWLPFKKFILPNNIKKVTKTKTKKATFEAICVIENGKILKEEEYGING